MPPAATEMLNVFQATGSRYDNDDDWNWHTLTLYLPKTADILPVFGSTIEIYQRVVNTDIEAIQLPAATIDDPSAIIDYTMEGPNLPAQLTFAAATRRIAGRPRYVNFTAHLLVATVRGTDKRAYMTVGLNIISPSPSSSDTIPRQ